MSKDVPKQKHHHSAPETTEETKKKIHRSLAEWAQVQMDFLETSRFKKTKTER